MVDELAGRVGVDVLDAQQRLDLAQAVFGDGDGLLAFVEFEVLVDLHARSRLGKLLVSLSGLGAGAGDDERGTRFVDEDRVDLVDDGEVVAALHAVARPRDHVVAQVVEAELRVGAVRDVGRVRKDALVGIHHRLDVADVHAEEPVDLPHPLGVALGQIVVDGDHVHAVARQRVEVAGEGGHERLSFTGLHLSDLAAVQNHAADELHVEVTHAERSHRCFACNGERLDLKVLERLAVVQTLAELDGLARERRVAQRLDLRLDLVDADHAALVDAHLLALTQCEEFLEEVRHWLLHP